MTHPDTRLGFVSEAIGNGVFATRDIPLGTIVYVIDPLERRITAEEYRKLRDPIRRLAETYSIIDSRGDRVLSWDLAKYVNHHCEPNSLSTGWGFEIAIRDIAAGEELTDDYGLFNLVEPLTLDCDCARCGGAVRGDDFERHTERWDAALQPALRAQTEVDQPLWELLGSSTRRSVLGFLNGTGPYRSVKTLRYRGADAGQGHRRSGPLKVCSSNGVSR